MKRALGFLALMKLLSKEEGMKRALGFLVVIGLLSITAVWAQQNIAGAPVSPTAQRGDYSAALTTATAAANSVATATVTPPVGQYVYMTALEISACTDATGDAAAATPTTFTYAGFGTNVIHKVSSTHTAGVCVNQFMAFPTPVKSAAPGTAVTITSSNITHLIPSINVFGYYAP